MFQDSHVHLQDIGDRKTILAVLAEAEKNGIKRMFCNATNPSDWALVRELAELNDRIIPFFGIHPWFVPTDMASWQAHLKNAVSPPRSGIGEIGLDKKKNTGNFNVQKTYFDEQLDMSISLGVPFVLHCVDAWGVLIDVLRSKNIGQTPFMIHFFSGSEEVLSELISLGAYISFPSKILGKGYEKMKKAFLSTPINHLLLETDFPDPGVTPDIFKNHPKKYSDILISFYAECAKIKNVSEQELIKAVWDNGSVFAD